MLYSDKVILFGRFKEKWNDKLKQIPNVLKYLSSYPEIVSKIEGFQPLSYNEVSEFQLEWISLIAQFDNPIETSFFKDYWVPIQKNGYDYFIDISSGKFPIFEVHYFFFEPYRWYKKYIVEDLTSLLSKIDDSKFDLNEYFEQLDKNRWKDVDTFFNERNELGFAGKLKLDHDIDYESVFQEEKSSSFEKSSGNVVFSGVNPQIVTIFPENFEIRLEYFNSPNNKHSDLGSKISNIKAFSYLVHSVGLLSIESYSFCSLNAPECKVEFRNNTLNIWCGDSQLVEQLIENYEDLKKKINP